MPQPHRHQVVWLLLFLLLLWNLVPEGDSQGGHALTLPDIAAQRLARYQSALQVLNQTHWGDFRPLRGQDDATAARYVNLTGFRSHDGFAWEDLELFREKGLRLSRRANPPVDGRHLWDVAQGEPVWANASGTLRGDWVRQPGSVARSYDSYNLGRTVPGFDWVADRAPWARNVTGDGGRMMLRLESNRTVEAYDAASHGHDGHVDGPLSGGAVRNVRGYATVEDTAGSGLGWEMRLWGLHWPRQGVILMTTTSEKFEGIFGLPHLAPGPDFFRSAQDVLGRRLARVVGRKRRNVYVDQNMPWSSDVDNALYTAFPSPHCEYVVYAQVHPPLGGDSAVTPDRAAAVLAAIESELQRPLGAPIHPVPELRMSAVVWSPDCAFFLETKGPPDYAPGEANHLVGVKAEVHTHRIKTSILVYALVVLAQVRLLRDQMRESFTPSTMGRVSFWTISAMVIVDGMTFTTAATWVSSAGATFLPTLALMFTSFLSMTIGGSFLAKIHEVQMPEGRARRSHHHQQWQSVAAAAGSRATPVAPSPSAPPTPGATGPMLPGPATAANLPVEEPVIIPSDQDVSAEIAAAAAAVARPATGAGTAPPPGQALSFQAILGRFILFSLSVSFVGISSVTWYSRPRSLFLNACAFAYLSLWLPQICRNTLRNCRRALGWRFVAGQSLLRLLPMAYFWVAEDNFLYAHTDRRAFALLCAWVWLQMCALAAQEVLGPRFGVPAAWTPEAWDYHPVLREDSAEAGGLPVGLVADDAEAAGGEGGGGSSTRAVDCIICREVLEVPVMRAGDKDGTVASILARRLYMVTPCRHIFHTACLEGWIRFRLQCPMCREELPPL